MHFRYLLLLFLPFIFTSYTVAQPNPVWDDTESKSWPAAAEPIEIVSSLDGQVQKAFFYKAPGHSPRPLVVSLHTWSGDYRQKDTLIHFCIHRGFHYIHPNFRGPNQNPEAMGSDKVVSDIDDAIDYSLKNANVDTENIHVIGVSGGGHATVLTYMKSKHKIRSFSAYVGIYNLIDWYYESLGRGLKYANDIAISTSGDRNKLDVDEARKRSPYFMNIPSSRQHSTLHLYCGIHDGYTGSVPVSQTLNMYNKIVSHYNPRAIGSMVPQDWIEIMTRERSLPGIADQGRYLNRKIIYKNHYKDLVRLTVFEGGHEMPKGDVLKHIPAKRILTIGDSNGAMLDGWVDQLQSLRPYDQIINTSVSGNTIGFDNQGQARLNTLKNIEQYLQKASGKIDQIVIMLGTNDCKAEFADRLPEVSKNLDRLIKTIKEYYGQLTQTPSILIVSPPPYGRDEQLLEKYRGASKRVKILRDEFAEIAKANAVSYIDIQTPLQPYFEYVSPDGVHLNKHGQYWIAIEVDRQLNHPSK